MIRDLVAALLPSGGQLQARRNAWAGMSEAAARARARGEADLAMAVAVDAARLRTGTDGAR